MIMHRRVVEFTEAMLHSGVPFNYKVMNGSRVISRLYCQVKIVQGGPTSNNTSKVMSTPST